MKKKYPAKTEKAAELTDRETEQATGGNTGDMSFGTQFNVDEPDNQYEYNLYKNETKEFANKKF